MWNNYKFYTDSSDIVIDYDSSEYVMVTRETQGSYHSNSTSDNLFIRNLSKQSTMSLPFEPPKNAIYIILGEIQTLVSSKKNNARWSTNQSSEESPEITSFQKLKTTLNSISEIQDIDSLTFLTPFLDIIRSEDISGPVTCLALNSINKFLSYGLIDTLSESATSTINKVANSITQTRFVGTNPNDDEVVLMKILQVLRSLLLNPIGSQMTNEVVCEILHLCFRFCFGTKLSELLRKTAEQVLIDMVQLLFARLPQFKDDSNSILITNQIKDLPTGPINSDEKSEVEQNNNELNLSTEDISLQSSETNDTNEREFTNPRGIKFTTSALVDTPIQTTLTPYGTPCVRDLLVFLTNLIDYYDKNKNEYMMNVALNLLIVAFEIGADYIANHPLLLSLVKDTLCRNLLSMLNCNRIQLFSASLRVSFLVFESLRTHLKCQFEYFITRLMELILSEQTKITYEQKEIALETIVQILRIPGLPAELYVNYDCDLYSTNLFEELTKFLSKNAFPVAGLTSTHTLSLDALLSVIDHIEIECQYQVQKQRSDSTSQSLTRPITCGYALALSLQNMDINNSNISRESRHIQRHKENRMTISSHLPSSDDLKKLKSDKKIFRQGSELFNQSPSSGLKYLQENEFLSEELKIDEIVKYLKDNPLLDKKILGEYLSNRKNIHILEKYVKTINFENMRVDEALRIYLSEFRLPGEAPLISVLLEHFAAHWRECNNFQLANDDAAFGLAYACIMLNTDQHNTNVRRQNLPMTCDDFKRNLSNMNNNENFDDKMLTEIYNAIKSDEIIMPTEHKGLVKESYMWKLILKRSLNNETKFLHVPTGSYNQEIFTLIWGQTMAALSFVFEKSNYDTVIDKSIQGFSKCAKIAAHYGMSDVFDNSVISLCKSTTLLNNREWIENLPVQFGLNRKARLAATTVFTIARTHGDILRDGWKNILECIIVLYKAKLLPAALVEVEDFLEPSGRITLIKEQAIQVPKNDTGLFSSLAYFLGGGGSSNDSSSSGKPTTAEEQEAIKIATTCVEECHLEQLIQETKFLIIDSLNEFFKALIYGCQLSTDGQKLDQDSSVFCLELLIRVVLQNRDRVISFWPTIRHQFYLVLVNANEKTFFVERTCIGLLRIAGRLLRREELASEVLNSLRMLLYMKVKVLHKLSSEIAYGLHEIVRSNAANIHKSDEWFILFSLLEVIGTGTNPPAVIQSPTQNLTVNKTIPHSHSTANIDSDNECSDCLTANSTDKGYTSDSEIYRRSDYIVVTHNDFEPIKTAQDSVNQHDRRALNKSFEIVSFLIRDVAYVTQENFEYAIHCIRTFIETTIMKPNSSSKLNSNSNNRNSKQIRRVTSSNSLFNDSYSDLTNIQTKQSRTSDDDDDSQLTIKQEYQSLALQLLELLYILHIKASTIYKNIPVDQTSSSVLWYKCWCPILQGITRLCYDSRRTVCVSALGYLQRCILSIDLQILSPVEWESLFNKVLFPLLLKLIEPADQIENSYVTEETRVRVSQLLCRIFLQHLTPLLTLPTFTKLWLTILDFMDKYSSIDQTDMLRESVCESLKNMILVMNTTDLFNSNQPFTNVTKDRIHSFLPGLWDEIFKVSTPKQVPSTPTDSKESALNKTESNTPAPIEPVASPITKENVTVNETVPVITNTRFLPAQVQNL